MSNLIEVELPNGTILYDVPETATDDEIAKEAIRIGAAKPEDFSKLNLSLGNTLSNIPGSGQRLLSNLIESVYNIDEPRGPIGSAIGLLGSSIGGYGKLLGADVPEKLLEPAQELAQGIKNRYGSSNALKYSIETDPLGTALDAAGLLSGAGSFTRGIGLTKAGNALQIASDTISPVTNTTRLAELAKQGIVKLPGMRKLPLALYNNAMKFSKPSIAREALARKVTPESLDDLVEQKNNAYDTYMRAVDSSPEEIKASDLFSGLDSVRANFPNPGIAVSAETKGFDAYVEKLAEELGYVPSSGQPLATSLSAPLPKQSNVLGPDGKPYNLAATTNDPSISMPDLQDFKTTGWERLIKDNGEPYRTTPSQEKGIKQAQMALTKNASNQLNAKLGKDYVKANREYGSLNDIIRELHKIINREAKSDIVHGSTLIPTGLSMAVGNAIGGLPGAIAGGVAALGLSHLNNPRTRMNLGLSMNETLNRSLLDYLKMKTPVATTLATGANASERKRRVIK